MKEKPAPHRAYIMVCTNDDCRDGGSAKLYKRIKRCIEEKGLKKKVRVMACGCFGKCDEGPNIVLEPGHVWCSRASKGDVERIVAEAEAMAEGADED